MSISYYALVGGMEFINRIDFTKADLVEYKSIETTSVLYDHKEIVKYARERLKSKLMYV